MNVDLSRNPKQEQFFNIAVEAAYGLNEYRNLYYGGGIRGGKTYVCLATLAFLAKSFPDSRWHVFRSDMPALIKTTIPSFGKIVHGSSSWKVNRDRSNYYYEYKPNGSRIFFIGENIERDPELEGLLGLETNGIMLEQIEELSEKLWQIGQTRNGSWYIDKMPKPIVLSTFNPTQKWIKQTIYEPWVKGDLKVPNYFMEALPSDNDYVTQDQWQAWGNLGDRYQQQFIQGSWADFDNENNRWAFSYGPTKHSGRPEIDREHTVFLSFDFNVNPMCCSIIQHYDQCVYVLETLKIPNSGSKDICEHIAAKYPNVIFMVTGDATGTSRKTDQQDNMHNYQIIKNSLNLGMQQLKVPSSNPPLAKNRVLVNSILGNYKVVIHEEKAKALHFDLGNVKVHPDGEIIKGDRKDPTQQADALDTFRYWCNTFMSDFVKNV